MRALWKRLFRRQVHDQGPRFRGTLAQVVDGRPVVISRAGRPVERALPPWPQVRRPGRGSLRGRIRIPADFDYAHASVADALGMG
ncbi:type II toxin-antitoxin system Phd/YefM family antitoxin [Streptomyces sp. NPDC087901]|uniref:type II toxin-antitoxin system Phd/YefM family antitoxin n=1 Tax=Streptomyces sp. NPDC087901 TaxID=3365818 RepID=UPI0038081090